MTTDVHLPTSSCASVEKLIRLSVLVDDALGIRHLCAVATHDFAMKTGPLLQKFSNGVNSIKEAMEIVLEMLFVAQHEFFYWLTKAKTATTVAARPPLSAHADIIKELEMGTYKIGKMPDSWACFMMTPKEAKTSLSSSKLKATTGGITSNQTWSCRSGTRTLGLRPSVP
jgi:hypothetical protein